MYGLPGDFDPRILVGLRLWSVTFATNAIGLNFDNVVITVEGRLPYRLIEGGTEFVDAPPVVMSRLVALVGRSICAVEPRSPQHLIIRLDGGGSISLLDELEMYESYKIQLSDREIIV